MHPHQISTCSSIRNLSILRLSSIINILCRSLSAQYMTFIPLYDHTGTTQLTCAAHEWRDVLSSMKTETVIKATGMVQERPENDQNRVSEQY